MDGFGCGGGPTKVIMRYNAADYPAGLATQTKNLTQFHTDFVIPVAGETVKAEHDEGVFAALMYDPLTVYYLMNPDACAVEELDVLVETKGELTRGMTVADLRIKPENNNPVKVVMSINPEKFTKDFIQTLSNE